MRQKDVNFATFTMLLHISCQIKNSVFYKEETSPRLCVCYETVRIRFHEVGLPCSIRCVWSRSPECSSISVGSVQPCTMSKLWPHIPAWPPLCPPKKLQTQAWPAVTIKEEKRHIAVFMGLLSSWLCSYYDGLNRDLNDITDINLDFSHGSQYAHFECSRKF